MADGKPAQDAPIPPKDAWLDTLEQPLTTTQLLAWERIELRQNRSPSSLAELDTLTEKALHDTAQAEQLSAICLSGGGIRSAAFSLGVVQTLAEKGLLTGFDYLSTVSGGGYLGAFLQRWILGRSADDGDEAEVQRQLAESLAKTPPQITQLREDSNFITPQLGLMSSDTWTALATSLRNISVNWTLFAPLFMIVAALPGGCYWLFMAAAHPSDSLVAIGVEAVALIWAMVAVGLALPTYRMGRCWKTAQIGWYIILPIVIATLAALVVASYAIVDVNSGPKARDFGDAAMKISNTGLTRETMLLLCAAVFVVAPIFAFVVSAIAAGPGTRLNRLRDLPLWILCGALAAVLLVGETQLAMRLNRYEWIVVFGPLAFLSCLLAAGWLFSVARSFAFWGNASSKDRIALRPDLDREWLVRISAILLKISLLWSALALICLILPFIDIHAKSISLRTTGSNVTAMADLARDGVGQFGIALGGIVSGLIGAFAGKSGATAWLGKVQKLLSVELVATLATFVFAILALWFAASLDAFLSLSLLYSWAGALFGVEPHWRVFGDYVVLVALLGAFLYGWGRVVDVNRFSLNGFYRNRLSRAFLGAARARGPVEGVEEPDIRHPDPFTGLDPTDNVRLHTLWPQRDDKRRASLFPIINVALNAVATKRLSWQERKALPFVMTPLACGSGWLGPDAGGKPRGAYVPARLFGGTEPDQALDGAGVTLAAATAISGAAASPNMGYHSSAATAFLMTLFNVRLGAWLPNPGVWNPSKKKRNAADDSANAVMPLLRELGGLTDEDSPQVYLSDGGHFENLGLYEVLRRRCTLILAIDAGCDPKCTFEDLGNAARKAAIDLNVELDFGDIGITGRGAPEPGHVAHAVARIKYPGKLTGTLIYLKPSLLAVMPIDVRAYGASSACFPHETTGDQWFGEAQFESYRSLGADLCRKLSKRDDYRTVQGGPRAQIFTFFEDVAESKPQA